MSRRDVAVLVAIPVSVGLVIAAVLLGWDHAIYRGFAWSWENGPHKSSQGTGYAFLSGIGSDLGEITILTGLVVAYRKINCNVKGCWRMQWRTYTDADGNQHHWCLKHHPDSPLREGQLAAFIAEHDLRKKLQHPSASNQEAVAQASDASKEQSG